MDINENLRKTRVAVLSRLAKTNVICHHLTHVLETTKTSKYIALNGDNLEELGIELSCLDLETEAPRNHSAFFRPLPKTELPALEWDKVQFSEWAEGYSEESRRVDITMQSLLNQFWGAGLRNEIERRWIQQKCYNEKPSIGTSEYTPDVPFEWQTRGDIQATSLEIPHCSFRIIHYAEPEESLRRSELLPIVAYMRWRMIQFDYIQHYTFPVLVMSIFRSKARILQAYHDGKRLHISKSRFYDFTENVTENYELFMRWIHGIPCGDTEATVNINGEKVGDRTVEMVDRILNGIFRQA